MERKIGEIFEYNGEWYQCVVAIDGCRECSFRAQDYCTRHSECFSDVRSDGIPVIFQKLEKVGEPIIVNGKNVQLLKTTIANCDNCAFYKDVNCDFTCYPRKCYGGEEGTYVEIKTKEDMEEKKLNLKPFDIQKAKEGKPVCTRDGHKARIICFDYNGETGDYPIVALVHYNKGNKCYERVLKYTSDGLFNKYGDCQHDDDLMMLPEKKEGWVNIYNDGGTYYSKYIYKTEKEATGQADTISPNHVATVKIEWYE